MSWTVIREGMRECVCFYCCRTIRPIYKADEKGRKVAVCPKCGLDWSDFIFDENGMRVR